MRILYHNPSVARRGQWAGERGRQLVRALEEGGVELDAAPEPVASEEASPASPVKGWLKRRLPVRWLTGMIGLHLFLRGTANTTRWSWRILRRFRADPPDVIVARYFEYEWTPLVAARILRRPLVLETHSPFGLERALRLGRPSRPARWMDRRMFTAATRIWVHTPGLRELVAELTDAPDKIAVIPFGIEDPGRQARPELGRPVEIVFAGSFYAWHGLEVLLAAFAQLVEQVPDVHLTLVGDGITQSEVRRAAEREGLSGKVTFTGWLERNELAELLARSHVGVAPYLSQSSNYFEPVKILDFQMAGLPVVASEVGEIPRMVADGVDGLLVPPGDEAALTAALSKLATDPELRGSLGSAARARARHIAETARAVISLCRAARP